MTDRSGGAVGQLLRFGLVGGANTLLTGALFYGLLFVLPAGAAFTVAYVCGLLFVVSATPRMVFGASASIARRLALAGWYVVVYLCGLGTTALVRSELAAPRVVTVIATLMVTAPLGFIGSRYLLVSRERRVSVASRRRSNSRSI